MVFSKINKTILTLITAAALSGSAVSAQELVLESSAAIVNSNIILQSELDLAQKSVEQQFKERGAKVDPLDARRAALEGLITRSIILQQGKQLGLNLTDTQIDRALAQTAANAHTTVPKLLATFGHKSEALNRQAFAEELIINEVRTNQVRRRIRISDAEVDLLARSLREVGSVEPSYHLAQIILPLPAQATWDQVNRVTAVANKIKKQARAGEDFSGLAAKYAEGNNAVQGGDLGYIPEGQVPVPFVPALLKAHNGDVIGPFRSPYGLHLLKLYDVSHSTIEPLTTYKASHILLTTSIIFSDEAAVKQLRTLRSKILEGKISFADAARRYSEDPGSGALGGELGYAPASRYDPGFARGLVALHEGEISEPIKSSFGWHLIYLEDTRIDKDNAEAAHQRARDLIYQRQMKQETAAWEREIRSDAIINVTDSQLIRAGFTQPAL